MVISLSIVYQFKFSTSAIYKHLANGIKQIWTYLNLTSIFRVRQNHWNIWVVGINSGMRLFLCIHTFCSTFAHCNPFRTCIFEKHDLYNLGTINIMVPLLLSALFWYNTRSCMVSLHCVWERANWADLLIAWFNMCISWVLHI